MHARAAWLGLALVLVSCAAPALGGASSSSGAGSGAILFKDNFASPASGWDRFKSAEGVMDYDGGGYRIMVNALQTDFRALAHQNFSDARLEVDAGKIGGPDENRIGLVCRYKNAGTNAQYYFFMISSDGYYGLGTFGQGQASLLGQDQMRFSDKIRIGVAVNHLRADCNGNALSLYVNGTLLAQVHNSTLKDGDIGLLAGTFTQPGVDVIFDNFVASKP